jgi:RecA-family ATPase
MERNVSMLETKGLFVLEYSFHQKAWRIHDLETTLKYNIGSFAKGEDGDDYRILAISESREQLREFRKSLDKQKEKR